MRPLRTGLLLLLTSLTFWSCHVGNRATSSDLLSEPSRVVGVRAASDITGFRGVPFLGRGWRRSREGVLSAVLPEAGVRFVVDFAQDLSVEIELEAQPGEFPLRLNGKALSYLTHEGGRVRHAVQVPESLLRVGTNHLALSAIEGARLVSFQVRPSLGSPAPQSEGRDRVAFGQGRDFLLSLAGEAELEMELAPWVGPGFAPPEAGQWDAEVEWRSDSEELGSATVASFAEARTLSLGRIEGQVLLRVRARSLETLSSGQYGVQIKRLTLKAQRPMATSSTTSPTSPRELPLNRPNIVIYLTDTLRADRLGCYGGPQDLTPAIDAFASDSVLFERAVAQSSWTQPAVASLFTGLYPWQHGLNHWGESLPSKHTTLAELLRSRGYRTAAFYTNSLLNKEFQLDQGFETFRHVGDGTRAVEMIPLLETWLDERPPEQPFLLYVHSLDPHAPYNPPSPFKQRWSSGLEPFMKDEAIATYLEAQASSFQGREPHFSSALLPRIEALYDGEVAGNDEAFGRLMKALKQRNLYEDTIIVFLSDHGEEFLDHGQVQHFNSLYQELIWIPLLIKFQGQEMRGTRYGEPVGQIDVMPTLLQALQLRTPGECGGQAFPGDSARTVFSDVRNVVAPREFQWERDWVCVREGDWVFHWIKANPGPRGEPLALYNLAADPGETRNLLAESPVTALRLELKLRGLRRDGGTNPRKIPDERLTDLLRTLHYVK